MPTSTQRLFAGGALLSLIAGVPASSQSSTTPGPGPWHAQISPVTVELRGLSVATDRVAWASGARGTVLRTIDGETWAVLPVPGAEKLDFRDIQAFDENTAIAMSIGPGPASNVFKTSDGGKTWRKTFANPEADNQGFWDAVAFWDRSRGVLFGDPVRGRFQVYLTEDGGDTWKAVKEDALPKALENEGAFAASGQCLATGPDGRIAFVTGGASEARVFVSQDRGHSFRVSSQPVPTGAPSKGLFAVHWLDKKTLMVTGGDYRERTLEGVNAAISTDTGAHWTPIHANPVGFLSSVTAKPGQRPGIVAVGLAGTGISRDRGHTWQALDATPYNTASFAKGGSSGWAVGPKGVIARWARSASGDARQ